MSNSTLKNISILLIEDSLTDAELMKASLQAVEECSFDVDNVTSLQEASKAKETGKWDAVLLDLGLPDSFGLPTFTKARTIFENLPIIVVTGNDDREVLAETMNAGADNYLIKGKLDGNRVAIAILSAMRNHR